MQLKFNVTKKGKSPLVLSKDIHNEILMIVSDDLEYIRGGLHTAAPSMKRTHDKRESHIRPRGRRHLKDYLNHRSDCQRRTSPYSGYVFFDEKLVPHIKFVIEEVKKHDISAKRGSVLMFWWAKESRWILTKAVKKSGGSLQNDFIGRVFEQSYSHIINTFVEKMGRALKR
jgi:hypothetical protein